MRTLKITAFWGNDDAESSINVSRGCWEKILSGLNYTRSAWSWYEGRRYPVVWEFGDRSVSIYGRDGAEWVVESPIEDLIITECAPTTAK